MKFFVVICLMSLLLLFFDDAEAFAYRTNTQNSIAKKVDKGFDRVPAILPYNIPGSPPQIMNIVKLQSGSKATIVKQEYERFKDGGYRFFYETSDGQSREEVGYFRDDPKLGKVLTVHGSYGYIGPTKKKVFVKYTSDERGYMQMNSPYPPAHLPSNIINQQLNGFKV